MKIIFQVYIAIALPLLTFAIFPPLSTSAQNTNGNMTSSNTTQGASVENMTDVGKISSLEGGGGGGGSSNVGGGEDEGADSDDASVEVGGGGGGSGSGSGGSIIIMK
jgi:hypothetical protein